MRVKMLDLTREYRNNRAAYIEAVNSVFDSGAFILGDFVGKFEKELSTFTGAEHAVGVGNGTDALLLALKAAGIGEGDEVITTPFTFFATAETIIEAGAVPVFCDIDEYTYNIDTARIEALITDRTKALLPVHLYGNPCNMTDIMSIAGKHNLKVIEDCAQSIGAAYNGKYTGTFGDAGTFSFFPTKNLGCAGDGGAVITNNDDIAKTINMLRKHGSSKKYIHDIIGYNSRLDALQAAILSVKIKDIESKNLRRIAIARKYNALLSDNVIKPSVTSGAVHIYHQYTIRVEKRDDLREFLSDNGIDTAVHYPVALHKQTALEYLKASGLSVSEHAAEHVLSLPIYPEISDGEIDYVCSKVNEFVS